MRNLRTLTGGLGAPVFAAVPGAAFLTGAAGFFSTTYVAAGVGAEILPPRRPSY